MEKRDDMRTGWLCNICGSDIIRDPEGQRDICPNCGEEWPWNRKEEIK